MFQTTNQSFKKVNNPYFHSFSCKQIHPYPLFSTKNGQKTGRSFLVYHWKAIYKQMISDGFRDTPILRNHQMIDISVVFPQKTMHLYGFPLVFSHDTWFSPHKNGQKNGSVFPPFLIEKPSINRWFRRDLEIPTFYETIKWSGWWFGLNPSETY